MSDFVARDGGTLSTLRGLAVYALLIGGSLAVWAGFAILLIRYGWPAALATIAVLVGLYEVVCDWPAERSPEGASTAPRKTSK